MYGCILRGEGEDKDAMEWAVSMSRGLNQLVQNLLASQNIQAAFLALSGSR